MKLSDVLRMQADSLAKWGFAGTITTMQSAADELDRREKRIKKLTQKETT